MLRKLNGIITDIDERILKILCWKNTKSNQQTISTILGWIFGWSLIAIFKLIVA